MEMYSLIQSQLGNVLSKKKSLGIQFIEGSCPPPLSGFNGNYTTCDPKVNQLYLLWYEEDQSGPDHLQMQKLVLGRRPWIDGPSVIVHIIYDCNKSDGIYLFWSCE